MAERPVDELDEQVLFRIDGGVAWIVLNRPEAANAITAGQRDRVIDHLARASGDLAVRVVVLTSQGKGFCTGADLRASRAGQTRPEGAPERPAGSVARLIASGAQRLIAAVLDCEKPIIAAVGGTAAGLGAHLAFACDLVIASEDASFIEVFVRRGIVADGGGAWLLPRLVGIQKAKELLFFGDKVTANDALGLGLVNRVVPAGELEAEARRWAERLANGPTVAIGLSKRLVNRSLDADRATAFHEEAMAQEIAMQSADAQEGVQAFVERRDPTYHGW